MRRDRLGLVGRFDEGGLARMSRDALKWLRPEKLLVVKIGTMPLHPEFYAGHPDATLVERAPTDDQIREWLTGLDVVLTFETPYSWALFTIARDMGVRTVLVPMFEYFDTPMLTRPDLLVMPVDWHVADAAERANVPTSFVPWPVDRDVFPRRFYGRRPGEPTPTVFLSVVGNFGVDDDRNGVKTLLAAFPQVRRKSEVQFLLRARQHIATPPVAFPRGFLRIDGTAKQDAADNWGEGDVFLYPRRYAGLSLPMQEALSTGLPVFMTNMAPQAATLPRHWLFDPDKVEPYKLRQMIDKATISPRTVAGFVDRWAGHSLAEESDLADRIADALSWPRLIDQWEAALDARAIDDARRRRRFFSMCGPWVAGPGRPYSVVYVGNFRQEHCTEVHVAASLEDLGADVCRIQENKARPDVVLANARRADLLLWTSTGPEFSALSNEEWLGVLAELRRVGVPTASFHLDLYLGLARGDLVDRANAFWSVDHVFTADGGAEHALEFSRRGINHHFLPPAVFGREAYMADPSEELRADLLFVGSYPYPHPEWTFRNRMISAAVEHFGPRLQLWGSSRGVRNDALNRLYASAKAALGDSVYSPRYCSDRFTETMGRGGFLVAPRIDGLDDVFRPGVDYVAFDHRRGTLTDFRELFRLVDWWLAHDTARERVRRTGFEHVRKVHTYRHRLADVLGVVLKGERCQW